MTDLLRKAFREASKLSDETDSTGLADEALAEHRAGKAKILDPDAL